MAFNVGRNARVLATWIFIDTAVRNALCLAFAAILCAVIVFTGLYLPQRAQLAEVTDDTDILKKQLVTYLSMEAMSIGLDQYTSHLESAAKKLDAPYSSATVTSELARLFSESNLAVVNETYHQPNGKGAFIQIEASFSFSGSYENVRKVMDGIYQLPFFAVIKEASLEYVDDSTVASEMNVAIFFMSRGKS